MARVRARSGRIVLPSMLGVTTALLLGTALPAGDERSSSSVTIVSSGEPCPGLDLEARVDAYLSRSPSPTTPLVTEVRLDRELAGTWRLELALVREGAEAGRRSFTAESCETVVDAAAFVIAVTVDPTVDAAVVDTGSSLESESPTVADPPVDALLDQPEPDPEPSSTPSSVPPHREVDAPRVPVSAHSSVRGQLGVAAGVMVGGLPGAGGVVAGSAGVHDRTWKISVLATHRFATRVDAVLEPDVGGWLSLWSIGLRGCGVVPFERLRLALPICAEAEGGQLFGVGFGFSGASSTRRPWAAVGATAGLAWSPHRRVSLGLEAGLGLPLLRTDLVIDGLETLHTVGPVFGRTLASVQVHFP